jgi:hypothetical protein
MDSTIKRQIQTDSSGNEVYAKYTWRDHRTNEEILNELIVTSILDKITSYKGDWIQHMNRMPRSRLPNLLTKYAPRGIRNQGRALKRLLED